MSGTADAAPEPAPAGRSFRRAGLIGGASALAAAAGAALLLWPDGSGAAAGAAASGPPRLTVTGAYVREPANPDVAAAYFTVHDAGGPDALSRVAVDRPGTVTLHSSVGGKMAALTAPRIPAGGTLSFQPGAYHVMLTGPGPLKAGDHVRLTLVFATAAPISVDAPVVGISDPAPTP